MRQASEFIRYSNFVSNFCVWVCECMCVYACTCCVCQCMCMCMYAAACFCDVWVTVDALGSYLGDYGMGGLFFTLIRCVFVCMALFSAIGCGQSDHRFQLAEHDSPSLMLPCPLIHAHVVSPLEYSLSFGCMSFIFSHLVLIYFMFILALSVVVGIYLWHFRNYVYFILGRDIYYWGWISLEALLFGACVPIQIAYIGYKT